MPTYCTDSFYIFVKIVRLYAKKNYEYLYRENINTVV